VVIKLAIFNQTTRESLKKELLKMIEQGRKNMGLDILVRCPNGELADDSNTPIISLYHGVHYSSFLFYFFILLLFIIFYLFYFLCHDSILYLRIALVQSSIERGVNILTTDWKATIHFVCVTGLLSVL
jgi:hypothetical protein